MNTVVEHVEDLAELNGREQVVLGDDVSLVPNAQLVEEDTPGDEVGQVEDGVGERHEQEHARDLVRVV